MTQISLLNWMLLSTVLLGVWWLCYRLALRQERSFAYNRAFLVLGPLLAAGLPLLPLAWPAGWGTGPVALPGIAAVLLPAVQVGARTPATVLVDWAFWVQTAYVAGVLFMLVRLGAGLCKLWQTARRLPREQHPGYTLVRTHGRLPTSSFGRLVFWDETPPLNHAEARQVLRHELAHVGQGHTYDRLLLELLRAVLWFNPFVHLCARALALTHEFLADEAALSNSADTPSYTHLLARQVASRLGFSVLLAHSFSYSQTLSRIAMIQKINPVRRWKQWLALPLLGLLFVVVACEKAAPPVVPAETIGLVKIDGQDHLVVHHGAETTVLPPAPSVLAIAEQMPELPGGGGPEAIVAAIQQTIVYPSVAPKARINGRVFASFIVTEKGEVQAIKILKSLGPDYDAAVLAAIQKLPRFTPGMDRSPVPAGQLRPVAVSFTVPISFVWQAPTGAAGGLTFDWRGWAMPPSGTGC